MSLPLTDLPYSDYLFDTVPLIPIPKDFSPLIFEATDSVTYLGLCFSDIYSLG